MNNLLFSALIAATFAAPSHALAERRCLPGGFLADEQVQIAICMTVGIPAQNGDLLIVATNPIRTSIDIIAKCEVSILDKTFKSGGVAFQMRPNKPVDQYIIEPQMAESLQYAFVTNNPPPVASCEIARF
ncbi:hypothetical protein [Mesorhizobium sp. INR15]|uniref:hypothetical protein n=1 Tax=Mesorhizobium sp. INR15 TaxID=2654248 RepID=UPI0018968520|nr:hypothetical protein [Mesorhizobium sp. INR15]QPC90019.1 hypothetical protein GA829_05120 [Mesorhizobium sp. INR15]